MAASDILFADVTDLLFRDVRSLSKPSGRGKRTITADSWLAGLAESEPQAVAHALTERLADALMREPDTLRRLDLLLICEEAAGKTFSLIEGATETAPLPLSKDVQHAALAADSLLKALGIAYGRLAEGMGAKERSAEFGQASQQAALHAIRMFARRQMLAYRACTVASAAAWKTMHGIYALARCHGQAATRDGSSSLEQEYLAALLLAVTDHGRMQRESLQAVRDFIAGLAALAVVQDSAAWKPEADTPSAFLLATGLGRGGHGMSVMTGGQVLPPNSLVIDCSRIVATLEPYFADGATEPPLPIETLRLLHDAWVGESAERKFHRTQFMPHADLITGFKEIVGLFSGAPLGRRSTDPDDAHGENGPVGEWSIVNESPDGFGIRHLGAEHPPIEIGDLVVLRPREHNQLCICLVRRISHGGGHFELGLQELCAQANIIFLPSEDITAFGQQVMLLPQLPGFGNAAGVIAAAGALKPHTIIAEQVEGTVKRYKLGSHVTSSSATTFHLLQAA